jgi:hypothetical protein
VDGRAAVGDGVHPGGGAIDQEGDARPLDVGHGERAGGVRTVHHRHEHHDAARVDQFREGECRIGIVSSHTAGLPVG